MEGERKTENQLEKSFLAARCAGRFKNMSELTHSAGENLHRKFVSGEIACENFM